MSEKLKGVVLTYKDGTVRKLEVLNEFKPYDEDSSEESNIIDDFPMIPGQIIEINDNTNNRGEFRVVSIMNGVPETFFIPTQDCFCYRKIHAIEYVRMELAE